LNNSFVLLSQFGNPAETYSFVVGQDSRNIIFDIISDGIESGF